RLDVAFPSRKHQRRQAAASAAHEAGNDVIRRLIGGVGRRLGRSSSAAGPYATARSAPAGRDSPPRGSTSPTPCDRCGSIAIVINRLAGTEPRARADKRAICLLEPDLFLNRSPGGGRGTASRAGRLDGRAADRPDG